MSARRVGDIADDRVRLLGALYEARLQLVYLDERHPTGTTPAVLARINDALDNALPWATIASAIEAAEADKTAQTGLAEGESATLKEGDAQ